MVLKHGDRKSSWMEFLARMLLHSATLVLTLLLAPLARCISLLLLPVPRSSKPSRSTKLQRGFKRCPVSALAPPMCPSCLVDGNVFQAGAGSWVAPCGAPRPVAALVLCGSGVQGAAIPHQGALGTWYSERGNSLAQK
jgi:hypothetical protein